MAVVSDRQGDLTWSADTRRTCSLCGDRIDYPFIHWRAERDLFICSSCCAANGDGLHADLVQIKATVELQRLYPEFTLERKRQTWREGYAPRDPESLPEFANVV